jgi:hypothetical protein
MLSLFPPILNASVLVPFSECLPQKPTFELNVLFLAAEATLLRFVRESPVDFASGAYPSGAGFLPVSLSRRNPISTHIENMPSPIA